MVPHTSYFTTLTKQFLKLYSSFLQLKNNFLHNFFLQKSNWYVNSCPQQNKKMLVEKISVALLKNIDLSQCEVWINILRTKSYSTKIMKLFWSLLSSRQFIGVENSESVFFLRVKELDWFVPWEFRN